MNGLGVLTSFFLSFVVIFTKRPNKKKRFFFPKAFMISCKNTVDTSDKTKLPMEEMQIVFSKFDLIFFRVCKYPANNVREVLNQVGFIFRIVEDRN